ncbi:MAG: glycogen debranching protein [Flavobacteriaceae bacterium]|nr:glycogen debranching protein [Flavobacteriaceae bacterium]
MKKLLCLSLVILIVSNCTKGSKDQTFSKLIADSPSIEGKKEYLQSPFVTAGDRVYMVGHQDGSFPELGWHIKGEMGGIWNHPIKLMDGFEIELLTDGKTIRLNSADSFVNYPFANKHVYKLDSLNVEIERWQFVPDGKQGIVVQLVIKNKGEKRVKVRFIGHSDLRPTWLGERTDMIDSKDNGVYDQKMGIWKIKDSLNSWHTIFGSDLGFEQETTPVEINNETNGSTNAIEDVIFLFHDRTHIINYFIAGSYTSEEDAINTYKDISENYIEQLTDKKQRYEDLARRTKLTVPDKEIEQAFEWVKYNCDWLVRTVPEVGTGIGAGIPDYPWWFGVDSEYALQGYMAIGQKEAVYRTIKLLDSVSNAVNGNGRIIHEMSTNGAVFNPGNINETPQYATLIWKIYQWNGDKEFLRAYFPTIKKGLDWLMTEKDADGNLFPDGFGMMEIHGMDSEMIDVAAYTQKAFKDASFIADALGEFNLAQDYYDMSEKLQQKINEEFWSDEFHSYADFIGTDEQALHLIEDAIVRADTLNKPWAVDELKKTKEAILKNPSPTPRPFVLHHNWVVNTPMEVGLASPDKAVKALATAEKYVNPFGVFVTGIDRDESAGSDDGSFKGSKIFSYTGAVMTLPTGVQIVSENNYGRPDMALNYMKRMTRTFSYALPGSIYEVSPDYGMITQAWNVYGFAVPIVEQFFGIQPDAANKKVTISPQMSSSWDEASLENVMIGNNEVSIYFSVENGLKLVRVEQSKTDWQFELRLSRSKASNIAGREGSMELIDNPEESFYIIKSSDKYVVIEYNE